MSDEILSNEALGLGDLHEEVTDLDTQIAAAAKDDMSDSEKAALDALVEQRNEAYKRNHLESAAE
jgi:hypothetical protein